MSAQTGIKQREGKKKRNTTSSSQVSESMHLSEVVLSHPAGSSNEAFNMYFENEFQIMYHSIIH